MVGKQKFHWDEIYLPQDYWPDKVLLCNDAIYFVGTWADEGMVNSVNENSLFTVINQN